jgi:hypothetical protein
MEDAPLFPTPALSPQEREFPGTAIDLLNRFVRPDTSFFSATELLFSLSTRQRAGVRGKEPLVLLGLSRI